MAIKFEDDKPGGKPAAKTAKAMTEARFATPIESGDPVNPDAESALPFAKAKRPEKKGKRR